MMKSVARLLIVAAGLWYLGGCATAGKHRESVEKTANRIIEQKQMEALGRIEPFSVEPPADTLRRRLMLVQNIPYTSPASLNTKDLEPIPHWPKDNYLEAPAPVSDPTDPILAMANIGPATGLVSDVTAPPGSAALRITMMEALRIAAKNNRTYQTNKENVFRAALSLDLERDVYRNTFTGSVDSTLSTDLSGEETTSGVANTGLAGFSRQFLNGVTVTGRIGLDLAKLLNPFDETSSSLFGDASISIPLLRGAGRHIVGEPLTQAEREAVYAIYTFERYKRTFAVSVASEYFNVLQSIDQINNAEQNYIRSVRTTRLIRRLADAGRQSPIQVDQSVQDELSARNSWISAQITYQNRMDSIKITLGLPPDTQIELDRSELDQLYELTAPIRVINPAELLELEVPPAEAPVELKPMARLNAGPYEIDPAWAIDLALKNRLDLRTALGNIYDAQRAVVVAADALRAEFSLLGSAGVGERRGLGSASRDDNWDLDFEKGRYNAVLSLDLPLERTREIANYRNSILSLERAVRDFQETEDSIKLNVRNRLRVLQDNRGSLQIQAQAVILAERRVASTNLSLQAGRVAIRDVLEAQRALVSAQNSLTSAMIRYRLAELELQRDLDVLYVDETGMWKEFSPQEFENEQSPE